MKLIPKLRKHGYLARIGIFLIAIALVVGTVSCDGGGVKYDLTISSTAGGSVTTPGEGTRTYDEGTEVTLVATADAGYEFVNWTGNVATIGNVDDRTTNITMKGDYSITANFAQITPMVAAGAYHTVGLKSDGTVISVGNNDEGQRNVVSWTDIIQVDAGVWHTVGLKSDGTVVTVGENNVGQRNVGWWADIVQVAAGAWHTVGVKADGTVVAAPAITMGYHGRCNVHGWTGIKQVSAAYVHTVGLESNGTVVAVGDKSSGQCNVGDWTNIVQVAAGGTHYPSGHTVGLKTNGTVVAVGDNSSGQCNVGDWTNIVQVAAGFEYTVGIKANGTVVAVGNNDWWQCNVTGWTNIVQVAAGFWHTVGVKSDGTVVATGADSDGCCNVDDWYLIVSETLFEGGSGTEGDPYQIADWNHLHNVRNYLDSCFILVNNLDSNTAGYTERANPTANGGDGWQPIGSIDQFYEFVDPFTGKLDGQGYEIGDLFIDRPDEDGVGLFGSVDVGGVIENVEIVDADVTGDDGVGILGGAGACSVSSSSSTGSVTGGDGVGGLMGVNSGNISDCYSTASLTSGEDNLALGGLAGLNEGDVSNSYATGSVDGFSWVGGLVGWNSGTIDNCCSTGSVTAEYNVVGGLAGENDFDGTVTNSYSTGNVAGSENNNGGLVGWNRGTLDSSYATGSVTGDWYVGGLVGENDDYATIDDSYSTGSVTGNVSVGGLVGNNDGTVSNSFWDTQTSGQGSSDGGTGKTTAQMKDFDTFDGVGWDISAVASSSTRNTGYVWNIVDDTTYPFLSWQPV